MPDAYRCTRCADLDDGAPPLIYDRVRGRSGPGRVELCPDCIRAFKTWLGGADD